MLISTRLTSFGCFFSALTAVSGRILTRHLNDIWRNIADPNDLTEAVGIAAGRRRVHARPHPILAGSKGSLFMRLWHQVFSAVMNYRTRAHDARLDPLFAYLTPFTLPGFTNALKIPTDARCALHSRRSSLGARRPSRRGRPAILPGEFNAIHPRRDVHVQLPNRVVQRAPIRTSLASSQPVDRTTGDLNQLASEEFKFVETTLGRSIFIKLSQGLLPEPISLAKIWNRPENESADVASGTWAEYLRWGSVHLDQNRPLVPLSKEAKAALSTRVWTAGLLEIIEERTPVRDLHAVLG